MALEGNDKAEVTDPHSQRKRSFEQPNIARLSMTKCSMSRGAPEAKDLSKLSQKQDKGVVQNGTQQGRFGVLLKQSNVRNTIVPGGISPKAELRSSLIVPS